VWLYIYLISFSMLISFVRRVWVRLGCGCASLFNTVLTP